MEQFSLFSKPPVAFLTVIDMEPDEHCPPSPHLSSHSQSVLGMPSQLKVIQEQSIRPLFEQLQHDFDLKLTPNTRSSPWFGDEYTDTDTDIQGSESCVLFDGRTALLSLSRAQECQTDIAFRERDMKALIKYALADQAHNELMLHKVGGVIVMDQSSVLERASDRLHTPSNEYAIAKDYLTTHVCKRKKARDALAKAMADAAHAQLEYDKAVRWYDNVSMKLEQTQMSQEDFVVREEEYASKAVETDNLQSAQANGTIDYPQHTQLYRNFLGHSIRSIPADNEAAVTDYRESSWSRYPFAAEQFRHVTLWQLHGLNLVFGSNALVVSNEDHPKIALYLHDVSSKLTKYELLEIWVENAMAGIPEFSICFHANGVVQKYQIYQTQKVFDRFKEEFSVPLRTIMRVLRWLKQCIDLEGVTYVLNRSGGQFKLYCADEYVYTHSPPLGNMKLEEQKELPLRRYSVPFNHYTAPLACMAFGTARGALTRICSSSMTRGEKASALVSVRSLLFMSYMLVKTHRIRERHALHQSVGHSRFSEQKLFSSSWSSQTVCPHVISNPLHASSPIPMIVEGKHAIDKHSAPHAYQETNKNRCSPSGEPSRRNVILKCELLEAQVCSMMALTFVLDCLPTPQCFDFNPTLGHFISDCEGVADWLFSGAQSAITRPMIIVPAVVGQLTRHCQCWPHAFFLLQPLCVGTQTPDKRKRAKRKNKQNSNSEQKEAPPTSRQISGRHVFCDRSFNLTRSLLWMDATMGILSRFEFQGQPEEDYLVDNGNSETLGVILATSVCVSLTVLKCIEDHVKVLEHHSSKLSEVRKGLTLMQINLLKTTVASTCLRMLQLCAVHKGLRNAATQIFFLIFGTANDISKVWEMALLLGLLVGDGNFNVCTQTVKLSGGREVSSQKSDEFCKAMGNCKDGVLSLEVLTQIQSNVELWSSSLQHLTCSVHMTIAPRSAHEGRKSYHLWECIYHMVGKIETVRAQNDIAPFAVSSRVQECLAIWKLLAFYCDQSHESPGSSSNSFTLQLRNAILKRLNAAKSDTIALYFLDKRYVDMYQQCESRLVESVGTGKENEALSTADFAATALSALYESRLTDDDNDETMAVAEAKQVVERILDKWMLHKKLADYETFDDESRNTTGIRQTLSVCSAVFKSSEHVGDLVEGVLIRDKRDVLVCMKAFHDVSTVNATLCGLHDDVPQHMHSHLSCIISRAIETFSSSHRACSAIAWICEMGLSFTRYTISKGGFKIRSTGASGLPSMILDVCSQVCEVYLVCARVCETTTNIRARLREVQQHTQTQLSAYVATLGDSLRFLALVELFQSQEAVTEIACSYSNTIASRVQLQTQMLLSHACTQLREVLMGVCKRACHQANKKPHCDSDEHRSCAYTRNHCKLDPSASERWKLGYAALLRMNQPELKPLQDVVFRLSHDQV